MGNETTEKEAHLFVYLHVIYLFEQVEVLAADLDLLYPPIPTLTKDSHNNRGLHPLHFTNSVCFLQRAKENL